MLKCVVLLFAASAVSCQLATQDVVFHLFTKRNPSESIPVIATVNSISTAVHFSVTSRTVFTIHNYGESMESNFNAFVVNAYLAADEDINVFAVDWSKGSSLYTVGLANAQAAGQAIASFINILKSNFGYGTNNVKIVGLGLGGHVAGIAAREAVDTVPHIVALDPSFYGWTHHPDKLKSTDADVVEVLHTTAGIMGYDYPLGTVDFYANNGAAQPGCGSDSVCSYQYSYVFYAESISAVTNDGDQFIGTKCEDYEEAREQQCDGLRNVVFGGNDDKTGVTGIYQFYTNNSPPFAQN